MDWASAFEFLSNCVEVLLILAGIAVWIGVVGYAWGRGKVIGIKRGLEDAPLSVVINEKVRRTEDDAHV